MQSYYELIKCGKLLLIYIRIADDTSDYILFFRYSLTILYEKVDGVG